MGNRWRRGLMALAVLMFAVAGGWVPAGEAQLRFSDYTWGAYGASREASRLGREDLMARENYCPTGGCVLRLESVAVQPARVKKGEKLTLSTAYTILTPEEIAIPVTVSREIIFQGKCQGRAKEMDSRKLNGTWSQEVDFSLPADAAPGEYTLKTRVSTGFAMEEKSVQFRVD